MKKLLVLFIAAIMGLSLCACGAEDINSFNYKDYCDVDINYYIKNETKTDKGKTADGQVIITVTPKDPDNTKIENISAKATATSPWSVVGGSDVEFVGYNGAKWMALVNLRANSALLNSTLKLNAKYLELDFSVSGEYKK